jgi:isoquinoline 1-oxidoreductase subunit beta
MGDVPIVEVEFLPSTEVPVGFGEPATTVVGPAIGNTDFAASGRAFGTCRFAGTP